VIGPIVVLVAALPAAARAPIVDSDPVTEAVVRAVAFWSGTPCGGAVTVTAGAGDEAPPAGVNAPSPGGPRAAMWATWMTPVGVNQFSAPPSSFTDCVVHINSSIWPDWQADDRQFAGFCKEMLHEYGHFEGFPDAGAAPGTIQYERPDLAHVPICERYRLVYGHTVYTPTRPARHSRVPRRRRHGRRPAG